MWIFDFILNVLSSGLGGRIRPRVGVPVIELTFYFVGAVFLFVISLGRWRSRPWKPVRVARDLNLDPTFTKQGGLTYLCSDVALFTGMAVAVVVLGVGALAYLYWRRVSPSLAA